MESRSGEETLVTKIGMELVSAGCGFSLGLRNVLITPVELSSGKASARNNAATQSPCR
jgi:hypothetical protein